MLKLKHEGFTIIETVMVAVIIVILGLVFFLRWSPIEGVRLDSAVRKIEGDIRYTQKLAISSQQRAGIEFNADGYSVYAVVNAALPVLANSPGEPCSTRPSDNKFVVDFTQPRCDDFSGVTLSFLNNAIAFDPIGKLINATSASNSSLPTQGITVNYKGAKTISIEEGTGRVSH